MRCSPRLLAIPWTGAALAAGGFPIEFRSLKVKVLGQGR